MAIYRSLRDFASDEVLLKEGDQVFFSVLPPTLRYTVRQNHLSASDGLNDAIFDAMSILKIGFCNEAYGYENTGGSLIGGWPEARWHDFAALTRVVKKLFTLIEGKTPSSTSTTMSNVLDFFRDLTATPNDKLLKELGIENPTNVPTELGLKLSQEITYAANRAKIIEIALQMKANEDAKKTK